MKEAYTSPEFEFQKVSFLLDILADSKNEIPGSGENEPGIDNPFDPIPGEEF